MRQRGSCVLYECFSRGLGDPGGQSIAPGDRVVLWLPSANRDPSVFVDPDQLWIRRQPNRHLAFGAALWPQTTGSANTSTRILV